jgi:hypothetical protein
MNKQAKIAIMSVVAVATLLSVMLVFAGPAQCNDRIDNDGDGRVDLSDAGCGYKQDNSEANCGDNVCSASESAGSCTVDCNVCGDGVVAGSETCDNGASNGACPSTCSTACTTNTCIKPDSCADTDYGVVVFEQGTTYGTNSGTEYNYTDSCIDFDYLMEFSCEGTTLVASNYSCFVYSANSTNVTCRSGACVPIQ